jgi:hypothetical protein
MDPESGSRRPDVTRTYTGANRRRLAIGRPWALCQPLWFVLINFGEAAAGFSHYLVSEAAIGRRHCCRANWGIGVSNVF